MPNPPKPSKPSSPFDPFIRKKQILDDLGVSASTLDKWIKQGRFPAPTVLNPGVGGREIVGWLTSVYMAHKASLPVRQAKVISDAPYEKRRQKKRKLTRPKAK